MTATAVSSALRVTGLRKSFGDTVVLDGIDLDVRAGSVFSLLGLPPATRGEPYGAFRSAGTRRLASRWASSTDLMSDAAAGSSEIRLCRSSGSEVRLWSSQSDSAAGPRNGFGVTPWAAYQSSRRS